MLLIPLVSRQSVRALFCSWCVVSQILVIIVEDNLCLDLEICLALLYLIWLIVNRPLTVLTILLPHVRLCLIDYLAFDHLYWINDNDFGISLVLRLAPLVTVTGLVLHIAIPVFSQLQWSDREFGFSTNIDNIANIDNRQIASYCDTYFYRYIVYIVISATHSRR